MLAVILATVFSGCGGDDAKMVSSFSSSEAQSSSPVSENENKYVRVPLVRGMNMTCWEMKEWRPVEYLTEEKYYKELTSKGFDHVRIPVDFTLYSQNTGDYIIDSDFLTKLDTAIRLALDNGLYAVLDMHGCGSISRNVSAYEDMLYSYWRQLSERYSGYDERLLFELLNEPNTKGTEGDDPLNGEKLNRIINNLIKIIRETNPDRVIVAALGNGNTVYDMDSVTLPEDDPNIIAAFHSYEPMEFTHQGVTWSATADYPAPCEWKQEYEDTVEDVINRAAEWSERTGRQVWLGEFGVSLEKSPESSVSQYLSFITRLCEEKNIGWCYWEFWMSFGAFNRHTDSWNSYVVDALTGDIN